MEPERRRRRRAVHPGHRVRHAVGVVVGVDVVDSLSNTDRVRHRLRHRHGDKVVPFDGDAE